VFSDHRTCSLAIEYVLYYRMCSLTTERVPDHRICALVVEYVLYYRMCSLTTERVSDHRICALVVEYVLYYRMCSLITERVLFPGAQVKAVSRVVSVEGGKINFQV
jgi:hypothetical protein